MTEKDRGQHFVVLVIIGQKFKQIGPKKCQMNHDNSFDKNIPDANSKKITQSKNFACWFSDRKRPWPTFCCLGHSDVNSHFKNFNTSNTSFTLCEPHKLKHTLSTLSSKHDSMCHRRTCVGQKFISENPGREFQVFREFQVITIVFLDCFICINEKSGICIAH